MPRKYFLALTYEPKIEGVRNGTIRQTIRKTGWPGHRFQVGDFVAFHGWQGQPYRSPWSWRTPYFRLTEVLDIYVETGGIRWASPGGYIIDGVDGEWDCAWWDYLDGLAAADGIMPPTGQALGEVLKGPGGLAPGESIEAQILRWGMDEEAREAAAIAAEDREVA